MVLELCIILVEGYKWRELGFSPSSLLFLLGVAVL